MITLFTGAPGAGKTAALVDLLSKLEGDRPIFVDGLNGLKLPHMACDATKWPDELPDGAILVIDEVQRVWRPRGPGAKVPAEVQALETHRHRGIDIYLTTQAPRLLDANVRALVGRHVHIRDTGWLGRHWYEWPEVNDSMAWKTCQNKRAYKLPRGAFELYKSASLHTKPVRKTPAVKYLAALAVVGALVGAALVVRTVSKGAAPPESVAAPVAQKLLAVHKPELEASQSVQPAGFIDDRIAFIPRVSDKPETAPAYDTMRVVVNMPLVVGGMCFKGACKCVTQQGTDAGLSHALCKKWMDNPPFDPYRLPPPPPRPAPAPELVNADGESASGNRRSARRENEPVHPVSVGEAPMPSGHAINARGEARSPSVLPPGSPVHTTQPRDAAGIIPPPSLLNPYRRS